jgi:hypothetical protein
MKKDFICFSSILDSLTNPVPLKARPPAAGREYALLPFKTNKGGY